MCAWEIPGVAGAAAPAVATLNPKSVHGACQALGADPAFAVTFVAVTQRLQQCQESARGLPLSARGGVQFRCLEPHHFQPEARHPTRY